MASTTLLYPTYPKCERADRIAATFIIHARISLKGYVDRVGAIPNKKHIVKKTLGVMTTYLNAGISGMYGEGVTVHASRKDMACLKNTSVHW